MGRRVSVSLCCRPALPTLAQVGDAPGAPASSRRAASSLPGTEKDRDIPALTRTLGWGGEGARGADAEMHVRSGPKQGVLHPEI